jgi:hypothetical protein
MAEQPILVGSTLYVTAEATKVRDSSLQKRRSSRNSDAPRSVRVRELTPTSLWTADLGLRRHLRVRMGATRKEVIAV